VLRRSGQLAPAQARLRLAIEVAAAAGCELSAAEAIRERALVLAQLGCTAEAVAGMAEAAGMLERLKPAASPTATLVVEYPASVRAWGDLLAILEPGTAGQAEQTGITALAVARLLGCDEPTQARVRIAGFLHGLNPDWMPEGGLPSGVAAILRDLGPRQTLESQIVATVLASQRPGVSRPVETADPRSTCC
jgi:hypothetical protein